MKKILLIVVPILIVFVSVILLISLQLTKKVNLDFTEMITLNYMYADKDIHIQITEKDDFSSLISLCKGTAVNDFSVPSCGFGTAELIFEGNGKKVILYPACDECNTMRLGNDDKFFYCISEENRKELVEILLKYGATFPCV